MARENKDLNIEQAQDLIDNNRGFNEQGQEQSIFNQFRQEPRPNQQS